MRSEGRMVVAALVRVDDGLSIDAEDSVEAILRTGESMHLGLHFRYVDASAQRESLFLRLASTVGATSPPPVERRFRDRPILKDTEFGTIDQTFSFAEPGTFEGTFRAEAEYERADWLRAKTRGVQRHLVEVPVRVKVR
ncbi:MAG TPA: hypothetical protein VI818_01180 [Candidatus Thermoplasmatota archaeon]|nr:hypothetical protein [Candidatus Thermoplasmatota archaeon]